MENSSVQNVGIRLKVFLGSAIVSLFVCVVLGGLSASGVVSMLATHVLFAIATVVAVIGVVTAGKIFRQRRPLIILSGVVTFLLVGSGLFVLDRLLAHERNELDSLSSPPLARVPAAPTLFPSSNSAPTTVNQQQGGRNNVQTGPITQGPGSALSFGQQGGITAGTINVNPEWGLTKEQLEDLTKQMAPFAQNVDEREGGDLITCVWGDPDSTRVAYNLVAAFRAAGWNLPGSGLTQAMYNSPPVGVVIKVKSRDASPPGLSQLVVILRQAGIEPFGQVDPQVSSDQFRIVIGRKP
jgi:hypothetical protein